jgi:hypothetical protein
VRHGENEVRLQALHNTGISIAEKLITIFSLNALIPEYLADDRKHIYLLNDC